MFFFYILIIIDCIYQHFGLVEFNMASRSIFCARFTIYMSQPSHFILLMLYHMMSCIWYAVKCQIYFTELKLISKLTNLKAIETISLY
jgi:hypothetical protein